MPIDPSLITDTLSKWQSPQFTMPDPLAQYAKLQALKNGIMQQQTDALDLQQKQQQIGGQQALSDAIRKNITPGPNGTPQINHNGVAQELGTGPYAYLVPKYMEGVATQNKVDADAQKLKLENQASMLDQASRYFASATDQPSWDAAIAHSMGLGADPAKLGIPTTYSDQAKAAVQNMALSAKDRLDTDAKTLEAQTKQKGEVREQQTQNEKDADTALQSLAGANAQNFPALREAAITAQTKAGRSPAAIPGSFTPEGQAAFNNAILTAEQRTTAGQAAQNARETAGYHAVEAGQRAQQIGISGADLALRNAEFQKKYGDALGNLSDNDKTIAQKIANGDYSMSILSRLPNKEQIMAGAIQANPQLTQATYDTKQSFTNPDKKQAQNLGTISRIVSHIGRYEQNSQQMGFAPGYALGVNLTGNQAALNEDAHAISGELEKLVSGGVGSVEQTREWQKALHSPSADARQKAVNEISQLVGGQYEGMNQSYKAALGSDLPITKYVSPAGQQWMKTKGINVTNAAQPAGGAGTGSGQTVTKADVQDYATKHSLSYAAAEAHVKSNGFTVK